MARSPGNGIVITMPAKLGPRRSSGARTFLQVSVTPEIRERVRQAEPVFHMTSSALARYALEVAIADPAAFMRLAARVLHGKKPDAADE
jgi:hypothetical protein